MIVKIISSEQTYDLRHSVLWPHKKKENCFIDIDNIGTHFGCFINKELVSVGSFFVLSNDNISSDLKQFRLRAMATNPTFKGLGAGSALLNFASKHLHHFCEAEVIWCDAREIAVDFYKKNNFNVIKGPYNIPIIGKHYLMFKRI